MNRRARVGLAVLGGLLLGLVAAAAVLAQGEAVRDKVWTGETVVVSSNETVDHDLYIFARTVAIDGTVNGDVVVAALDVTVNGTVTGDLLSASRTLAVHGSVQGDVRSAGQTVEVFGSVGEDAAIVSSDVLVASNSHIGQDLLFGASTVAVDGAVGGGIRGGATAYSRRGTVGGPEDVTINTAASHPAEETTRTQILNAFQQFFTVLIFGALGLWLAPWFMRSSAGVVRSRPIIAFGGGILAIVGYVALVIAIAVLVTLVAIGLGGVGLDGLAVLQAFAGLLVILLATLALVVVAAFLGDAVIGLALGRLVSGPGTSRIMELFWLAIGAAIVVLVTSLPVVGPWIKVVVALVALGAVTVALWESRRRPPATAPATVAASPWGQAPG